MGGRPQQHPWQPPQSAGHSHDGLIIQRNMALFFSVRDRTELKLRVTVRIWKEQQNPDTGACIPNLLSWMWMIPTGSFDSDVYYRAIFSLHSWCLPSCFCDPVETCSRLLGVCSWIKETYMGPSWKHVKRVSYFDTKAGLTQHLTKRKELLSLFPTWLVCGTLLKESILKKPGTSWHGAVSCLHILGNLF
jgi:hypothetical protein